MIVISIAMFRSANTSRILTNDPNYILTNTRNIRSIDQILHSIRTERKPRVDSHSEAIAQPMRCAKRLHFTHPNTSTNQKADRTGRAGREGMRESGSGSGSGSGGGREEGKSEYDRVFQVIYGAYKPYKKHKQFAFDGFLTFNSKTNCLQMYTIAGKRFGSCKTRSKGSQKADTCDEYVSGNRLVIGSNELEIANEVSVQEFQSGMYFIESDD